MTTPQVTTRMNQANRKAFTLVELMVVILIIGLLVAISSPFIFAALTRARAFTIQNEMMQIDAAVKRFETEHGFYPPAIGPGLEIDSSVTSTTDINIQKARLNRYLLRIAPNHAESGTRIDAWWAAVGTNLDADSSLVFWLSGLCTSKQFPLTGGASLAGIPAPYNANKFIDGSDSPAIDRNVFFEFAAAQLVPSPAGIIAGVPEIKAYNQPNGRGDSIAYLYLDSKSYAGGNAYHAGVDADGNPANFFNPGTFQLMGPGMDGQVSGAEAGDTPETNTLLLAQENADVEQDDNMTNFSGGRLDLVFE